MEVEGATESQIRSLPIAYRAFFRDGKEPANVGNFLGSFVIDARGGVMRSAKRTGLTLIFPAGAVDEPTRVVCRHARRPPPNPAPLMEGEALAARMIHMESLKTPFLTPIVLEVPTFTSECEQRELVVFRSDDGEMWQDHYLQNIDNEMIQDALSNDKMAGESPDARGIVRIVTCDFPQYFAIVSRVRQEMHILGKEGGTISSRAVPQVQVLFPPGALTKRIRVGLQAQTPTTDGPLEKLLGPVVTLEPRRRKFHDGIVVTLPMPQSAKSNKINKSVNPDSKLRLLCSITGGQVSTVWEDVTSSTQFHYEDGGCILFNSNVSARFWLIDCRNVPDSDSTKYATKLYREMLLVPFEIQFVVLGKKVSASEGRLFVTCLTDQRLGQSLTELGHYAELSRSPSVSLLDSSNVDIEFLGNLLPDNEDKTQLNFRFEAFKEISREFSVHIDDSKEAAAGQIRFIRDPQALKGEVDGTAVCTLDIQLPEEIAPKGNKIGFGHRDAKNMSV